MLWIKTLHIVFIAAWFAGLFYLPRIYVNLAQNDEPAVRAALLGMARRLFRFTTLLAVIAVIFGLWLYIGYGIGRGPGNGWMHAKLFFVLLIIGYHHACGVMLRKFEQGRNTRTHTFYRWFNEVPVLLLFIVVALVVVKPFSLFRLFHVRRRLRTPAQNPDPGQSAIVTPRPRRTWENACAVARAHAWLPCRKSSGKKTVRIQRHRPRHASATPRTINPGGVPTLAMTHRAGRPMRATPHRVRAARHGRRRVPPIARRPRGRRRTAHPPTA